MAINDLLTIYKALSDETRLKILKLLEHGELCVCDIVFAFDTVQPKISFHLSILKEAGLIKDRKQGKWSYYSLKDDELFKRLILISTIERIEEADISIEKARLSKFFEEKKIKNRGEVCKC
ncbi:MAG: metalloregulator ArsR/SmtB family transcription factor [Proteobacteria bacterium]|nr:metalloregulator ArsR/SmtB family transcription factor [Pseudomonadota bacterium]